MILPILRRGATELGLNLSAVQIEQFEKYYQLLVDWNERFNLTAVSEYVAVQIFHFLDSLSLIESGVEFDGQTIIDVGAGAGFPGIPLKIAFPNIQLTLLEATGKKTIFLAEIAAALGLTGVIVLNARAEEAARQAEHREQYDTVISRAVASLDTLCELCLPFCRLGGTFIAMKKGEIQIETEEAAPAIETLGGRLREIKNVNLAGLPDIRKLVIIDKITTTPAGYPRRSGMPSKKPLR